MNAREIISALAGQWHGTYGLCRCPAHADHSPSLSITERSGRVLVRCHAGCEQAGVIDALKAKGLWHGQASERGERPHDLVGDQMREENDNRLRALEIWCASRRIDGTLAHEYLRCRGVTLKPPPSLRFHPRLLHSFTGTTWPAIVAAIQGPNGKIQAIQRIFIGADGHAKAPVDPVKLSLGPMGDGALRLAPAPRVLGIAEGVETGLSARQLFHLPVWISCGAGRLHRLALPKIVRQVIVFADNDLPGREAATRAAEEYQRQGRDVTIRYPDEGGDFNDWLLARSGAA